jgi:hypothetical protein
MATLSRTSKVNAFFVGVVADIFIQTMENWVGWIRIKREIWSLIRCDTSALSFTAEKERQEKMDHYPHNCIYRTSCSGSRRLWNHNKNIFQRYWGHCREKLLQRLIHWGYPIEIVQNLPVELALTEKTLQLLISGLLGALALASLKPLGTETITNFMQLCGINPPLLLSSWKRHDIFIQGWGCENWSLTWVKFNGARPFAPFQNVSCSHIVWKWSINRFFYFRSWPLQQSMLEVSWFIKVPCLGTEEDARCEL